MTADAQPLHEPTDQSTPLPELPEMLDLWQQTLGWQPSSAQQEKFQVLYKLILSGNRQFNLTRITQPSEFWEKHLWDSLSSIFLTDAGNKMQVREGETASPVSHLSSFQVIDIGTGAGFPGLPVAIARSDWTVTLLDATRKKITFLEGLATELAIENIKTWCDRAEQAGRNLQHRGAYDLALVRAVAPASVCAEYALPLLKLGGAAILYRGQWTSAEAVALNVAVEQLGGKVEEVRTFKTPLSQSVRHCLYLKKITATPSQFPRSPGIPTQKPLGVA